LRTVDPLVPERLVLGFFGWPVAPPQHCVLKEFAHSNPSFPAKTQNPFVPLESPSIPCLLMAEKFGNLVVIEE
jgi:hypothetical protein